MLLKPVAEVFESGLHRRNRLPNFCHGLPGEPGHFPRSGV